MNAATRKKLLAYAIPVDLVVVATGDRPAGSGHPVDRDHRRVRGRRRAVRVEIGMARRLRGDRSVVRTAVSAFPDCGAARRDRLADRRRRARLDPARGAAREPRPPQAGAPGRRVAAARAGDRRSAVDRGSGRRGGHRSAVRRGARSAGARGRGADRGATIRGGESNDRCAVCRSFDRAPGRVAGRVRQSARRTESRVRCRAPRVGGGTRGVEAAAARHREAYRRGSAGAAAGASSRGVAAAV